MFLTHVSGALIWDMLFNVKKCKVFHFGFNNPCYTYYMNNEELSSDTVEKDLGVYITTDLKTGS